MYYIYHILGIKVGCTENIKQRSLFYDTAPIVIATTPDIEQADWLENDLSCYHGYGEIPANKRYKYIKEWQKKAWTPEAVSKRAETMRGVERSPETKDLMAKAKLGLRGEKTNAYGKGRAYRELTNNISGYCVDVCNYFNITSSQLCKYVERDLPISRGKNKGLHFQILKP